MKNKEEFITEEKVINTPAGGVLIGKDKEGQTIIPNDGSLGGFLIGRLHKDGGIKAINKGTGQPLEMQSNEIVITAPAVADTTKREFEGKMMTNREILSKINSDGGGVSFADGGDIPAKIHTTDKEYEFGGKMVHDTDIAHSLGMNSTLKKGKQQFSSGNLTYDVDAIYNAIKKGKLRLKTKEVETFPMKYPVYDKKYSETVKADFRKPNGITVRTESGEEVLIDGNHRMNNAYLNGRKTMKTYYIEDPKQIAKFTKKNKFELGGENKVGGHLSKGKSLKQIAEMHNVSLAHINEELAKGLEVEKEHFADFKERTRVAKDHLVENPNYYTILEKAGLKKGGQIQKNELVENSEKGDTPARDLNNYNDVMDLQADGAVGGDSGVFADGGETNKVKSISDLSEGDLKLYDRASNIRNSEIHENNRYYTYLGISIYTTSENRNNVFVENVDKVFNNFVDAENYIENNKIEESKIPLWIGTEKRYYELYPNKKGIYNDGGITPYDANLEGDSVNIIENGFAGGGGINEPKLVDKIVLSKDLRQDKAYEKLVGTEYYSFNDLKNALKDAIEEQNSLYPTKANNGGMTFSLVDSNGSKREFFFYFNDKKKNTVANFNPLTGKNSDFEKQLIRNKAKSFKLFDWQDWLQSKVIPLKTNSQISNASNQTKDAEYYEYIGKSRDGFTNGKIYEAKYRNLEAEGNFIDDNGDVNGFSGSNYKYFKPSNKEAFLVQQGGSSKSNKDNEVFGVTIFYKEDGVEKEIATINEESLLDYLEVIQLKNNPTGVKLSIMGFVSELDNKFVFFTKQPILSNDIDPENITISEFRDFLSKELFPQYNFEFFFKREKTTTSKAVKPFDLTDSKIWIGDNPELSKKIQEFAFANGIYWVDGEQSVIQTDKPCLAFDKYGDKTVITFRYNRKEFDKLNLREITEEDIFGNKQTPTSIPVVPKITSQDVYSLDLAIKKLEKVSSLTVSEYSKDIYDKSLDLLYDEKKMYELALKFTPESAFLYERVDILRKLANIEKSIKKIEDMKKGGAFYILSKIIEKLERGEKWQESEQADGVITNKLPQSEIDIIIRSQKFKNWFGDWEKALVNDEYDNVSKALTNGIPSVYHHGARRIKYTYREVSNGVLYLAENISYALWFSQNATAQSEEGNYLTECFVNIKNPIDLTPFHVKQFDLGEIVRFIEAVYPLAKIYDFIPAQIALLIKANEPTNIRMWAWQLIRSYEKFVRHIKENTPYDGFLYYENNPSDMVTNPVTGELEENVTKAVAIFRSPQVKVVDAVLFDGGLDDWRFENGGKLNN